MNEALRDWVTNVANTFYCIGTVAGPHPYPMMVRDFQCVIGDETRAQMQEAEGRLPDSLIACIGGGSNAMGLFHPFLDDRSVEIYGVEAAGHGLDEAARGVGRGRAARRAARQPHLSADGRRRPDRGGAFDLGRSRLSRHRPGARLARRHRPGEIPLRDRQGGAGGVPALQPARRHHPGARAVRMRWRELARPRAEQAEGSPDGGQSLRPRRQGPRQRRASISGASCDAALRLVERHGPAGPHRLDAGHRVGVGYLLYFLKVRLFEAGPADHQQGMVLLSSACWC